MFFLQTRSVFGSLLLLLALLMTGCSGTTGVPPAQTSLPNTNDVAGSGNASPATASPLPTNEPAATSAFPTRQPSPTTIPLTATAALTQAATKAPTSLAAEETLVNTASSEPTLAATSAMTATTAPVSKTQAIGSEILFLRQGRLMAADVASQHERTLVSNVREFTATPDGRLLALVRVISDTADIWTISRDGSNLQQLTNTPAEEGRLSWAPDGMTLLYTVSSEPYQYMQDWQSWAQWCTGSEVRLFDIPGGEASTLQAGCDAAFSRDGLRIAFATPPQEIMEMGVQNTSPNNDNTIRLVNRKGEHGWAFATADGESQQSGLLVYAPAWSPDSQDIVYHRFIGYQALVDMNYTEIANSYEGQGELAASGAGWLLPVNFSPDGTYVAMTEYNPGNAQGVRGYEMWRTQIVQLDKAGSIYLPEGERETVASTVDRLSRVTAVSWSPEGTSAVVALPQDWQPGAAEQEPLFETTTAASLWRWQPGQPPAEQLVAQVDYASPIAWLPPMPLTETTSHGYQIVYPAGWQSATAIAETTVISAPDGIRLLAATHLPNATDVITSLKVAEVFPDLVGMVETENDPFVLPDGSIYHTIVGTSPNDTDIVAALRVVPTEDHTVIALLYRTTSQRWPLERAWAQALLATGGS